MRVSSEPGSDQVGDQAERGRDQPGAGHRDGPAAGQQPHREHQAGEGEDAADGDQGGGPPVQADALAEDQLHDLGAEPGAADPSEDGEAERGAHQPLPDVPQRILLARTRRAG